MSTSKNTEADKAPESGELLRKDGSYLSQLVEDMMQEIGVSHYDTRTVHLLVDILQRESLSLLQDAQEQSDKRISQEKQMLLQDSAGATLPKLSVRVSEEDAQVACQQYMSKSVAKASFLQDIKDMQRYANDVRLGVKTVVMPPSKQNRSFHSAMRWGDPHNMGYYPTGAPPHLPENIALNTLVSCLPKSNDDIDDVAPKLGYDFKGKQGRYDLVPPFGS